MKKVNGKYYSKDVFDGYNIRFILELDDKSGVTHKVDIYTTQTSVDVIWDDVSEIITDKVIKFRIIHTATKHQDDLCSEMINEWINNDS